MGREAIKIPQIRSVYGDQIICDGGPFGVGRQGGVDPYYPVGDDCVLYHAYWDGTATDHSSYGNDGTVTGATFVENGLSFDGNDDKCKVTHNDNMDHSGAYSLFTWLYSTNWAQDYQYIIGKYTGIPIQYSLATRASKVLYQYGGNDYFPSTFTMDDSAWICICTTQAFPGNMIFYKNTVSDDVGPLGSASTVNNTDLYTGDLDGSSGLNWNGIIGEVLIFNTEKSSAQVTAYYNATSARYA